ncbi:MAG TPA: protein phosphatase CheZ [Stellaceae bacterium]|nr:protein phosphatase CheZ [Stellaceae bacterium]
MSFQKSDDDLASRLEHLREGRPTVKSADVASAVEEVVGSLSGAISAVDMKLYHELGALAEYIQAAKLEIAALRPDDIREQHIPMATDELDAVVEATAKATGEILDTAEQLEALGGTLAPEIGVQITDAVTRIFEACNFQDVTGQRITKVVKTLKHIEIKIGDLLGAFGDGIKAERAPVAAEPEPIDINDESKLLNGPQLTASANNQSDIDAILAGLA